MKAVFKIIPFVVAAAATAVWFSLSSQAQNIDPATGLSLASARPATVNPGFTAVPPDPFKRFGPINHDPKTGLPKFFTVGAGMESGRKMLWVDALMTKSQYADALQLLLDNHRQFGLDEPLHMLVPQWIELGRRFPKARGALLEIRDEYQNYFSAGSGCPLLFDEINTINRQLDQDDATYALFQLIRQNNPKLAEQCFGSIAPLLIQRGEFDLCMSFVGNPRKNFEALRANYESQLDHLRQQAEWNRQNAQRAEKTKQHLGLPDDLGPFPASMKNAAEDKKPAEDNFVNATRQLIHILVGAGHKAEAEEIQHQAAIIRDDPGLKSAVSDADRKIKRWSGH